MCRGREGGWDSTIAYTMPSRVAHLLSLVAVVLASMTAPASGSVDEDASSAPSPSSSIAAGGGGESSVGGGAAAGGGVGGVNASAMIRELFELEYEGPGTQRSGCVLPWSDEGIASNRRFL